MVNIINDNILGIFRGSNGIWTTNNTSSYSYRDNGHAFINEVEEDSFWYSHRNRCIIHLLKKYEVDLIVDVGGGSGLLSQQMARNNIKSILIEPAIKGVHMASKRGVSYIIHGSFADCTFKEESMSNFGFFDVMEHIQEDDELLQKTYSALIQGGRIFITVPAFQWLWSKNDEQVGHFRRYSLSEIKRKLESVGFTIEYKSYLFWFLPLPIMLFRKLLYKNSIHKKKEFEHAAKSWMLSWLVRIPLFFEFTLVKIGFAIPFGSTCLLIARK